MNAIEATGLMFRYRDDWVISGVDLTVKNDESIAVIGPNGSGKSTLLKLLAGIVAPEEGRVSIEGVPIKTLGRKALSRRMALVSQEGSGQFPFTVADVVLMGRAPYLSGFQMERQGDHERARRAMETTDIADLADRPIGMLSGGERQRAFIARALCQDTPILLLDEPTAFLDIAHQVSLLCLIRRLHTSHHKTIVSVTHDINLAASFFDRIVILSDGRVSADGRPEEVITEDTIKRVYGTTVLVDTNPVTSRPRVTLMTDTGR
ncbi:MAG: ABC transporter ATP-binding protein [Deltaproteobacteria bacterium]|nr:ABC transporter ATP-binding protein [Candidatus Zymogenaceae bacterium]